jgi:hypothetical protein
MDHFGSPSPTELTSEQVEVRVRGAPFHTINGSRFNTFHALVRALDTLESRGSLTNSLEQTTQVKGAISQSLERVSQVHLNSYLLGVVNPVLKTQYKAWIVGLLFEKGAFIEQKNSYQFLNRIFDDKMTSDVLNICEQHWQYLINHGLDVNGVFNNGADCLLRVNIYRPHVIKKALKHGADPYIKVGKAEQGIEAYMRYNGLREPNKNVRKRILQSMAYVRAAKTAIHLSQAGAGY